MYKIAVALVLGVIGGAVIGAVATYHLKPDARRSAFPAASERDIQHVPEISIAAAQIHRQERYASIKTIEDTLALPTDFAETEALYVIAGRSDSSELQDLIYQASRIVDRQDRRAALSILLGRLTELDPYSALAIARDSALRGNSNYENDVWTAWGRLDLDGALQAARAGTTAQKNSAAQALYAAVRDHDAEKMQLIKSTLRVSPGRNTRAQQIYTLADQSPAEAIRFIESQGSQAEQLEKMAWLANYLILSTQAGRTDYAGLIQSPTNRRMFEEAMANYGAQADPEAALEKYLAEPDNQQRQARIYSALQALAQQDPNKALTYLEQFPDKPYRQSMVSVVLSSLAESDPRKALAWARDNDKSVDQSALVIVIGQIARQDPQLALTEAQSIQNNTARQQAVGMILMVAAKTNPSEAVEMLTLIDDRNVRRTLVGQLGRQWAATDFEAATQWISSLSSADQRLALQSMGRQLANSDVDRAITLLNRFPSNGPRDLKQQIAQSLAANRSIEAAQSFISKYEGTDEYPRLQMTVISNVAISDPDRAMQMAGSVQNERIKDQLYTTIISRKAAADPRLAMQWMESISNAAHRQQAMTRIVMAWHSSNPNEANAWVSSLPRGVARDDAVVAMVAVRPEPVPESLRLIESIGDADKRRQAMLGHFRQLIYSHPDEAERMLMTLELSDTERVQYQQMIDGAQYNGYAIDY